MFKFGVACALCRKGESRYHSTAEAIHHVTTSHEEYSGEAYLRSLLVSRAGSGPYSRRTHTLVDKRNEKPVLYVQEPIQHLK